MKERKGQIEWDTLIPWIIGIVVLSLVLGSYFLMKGSGGNLLEGLRNALKFR